MLGPKEQNEVKTSTSIDRPHWLRYSGIFIRAIHQIGAAIFLGSYVFKSSISMPESYIFGVGISGLALLIIEGIRHRQFLREVFGLGTILKIAIIGLANHNLIPALPAVAFAFFLSSIISHAPKAIRHRLIL